MNNIGIILNQDNNNQSYLGKFYQRNQLEFPVIRKIYEQSETSKNLISNNNQKNILENNNLNETNLSASANNNLNETNRSVSANNNVNDDGYVNAVINDIENYIENETINKQVNGYNDDIIILDKSNYTSVKNDDVLNTDISDTANTMLHNNDQPKIDNNKSSVVTENIKISNQSDTFSFNNSELLFLWLSSILLIFSLEYYITINILS